MNKEIRFDEVSKSYGETEVVKSLNFTIREGERLILLGPSGCGKSTTLRMIAGLEPLTTGDLYMGGERVNDVPSGQRDIAMVFQNYALYPHMTVWQNITYGLRVQRVPKDEVKKRANEAVRMLKLEGYEDRLPKDLSGGQRQRVALARAIVKQSQYFLLDEPLSNLDAKLRATARKELVNIHEAYRQTFVYVTHDQVEAMTVGERIALMYEGELQMLDTPERVYHQPRNIFTATFIGSPPMNVIDVSIIDDVIQVEKQRLPLPLAWRRHLAGISQKRLTFGVRPEHLSIDKEQKEHALCGTVKYVENHGDTYAVYVDIAGVEWIALHEYRNWTQGETVYLTTESKRMHFFDQETTLSLGYPIHFLEEEQ